MPDYAKAFPNSPIMHVDGETQIACIDLPGETVRCIRRKPKLRVVLRKHRDVVFDINLGIGGQYSVESEQSDFYNTRDKKLVRSKTQVEFNEGERLHLWVSRAFTDALLLKHNGKLIARYEPNQLDPHTCTAGNPEGKPAPLIVSMQLPHFDVLAPIQTSLDNTHAYYAAWASATESIHQSMHVHEIQSWGENVPQEVLNFLQNGGDSTALDSSGVMTRNWIIAQLAGTSEALYHQWDLIQEVKNTKFRLEITYDKKGVRRSYLIFKGNPKIRKIFKGVRYASKNPVVWDLTFGAGTLKGVRHQAWKAAASSFKKDAVIGIVFAISIDAAEWIKDYQSIDEKTGKPKKTITDLILKIGIDLAMNAATAITTALIMAAVVLAGVTGGAVLVAGALVVSIAVGYILSSTGIDKKIEKSIKTSLNKIQTYMKEQMPNDYSNYDLERNIYFD